LTDFDEICHDDAYRLSGPSQLIKLQLLKSQMAAAAIFKNEKIEISQNRFTDFGKILHSYAS